MSTRLIKSKSPKKWSGFLMVIQFLVISIIDDATLFLSFGILGLSLVAGLILKTSMLLFVLSDFKDRIRLQIIG